MKYSLFFIPFLLMTSLFANPLQELKEGNQRFAASNTYKRKKLKTAQSPVYAILACADSRVAPELIFDQDLGDLFVVRLAGNVATQGAMESLDFASNVLKVSMLVVMGHQNCGAIGAVMRHEGDQELGTIASMIEPSMHGQKTLKEGVIANVKAQVKLLKEHALLKNRIEKGELEIVGAYYDFSSGKVDFFEKS